MGHYIDGRVAQRRRKKDEITVDERNQSIETKKKEYKGGHKQVRHRARCNV
jgi:hypothetical protein